LIVAGRVETGFFYAFSGPRRAFSKKKWKKVYFSVYFKRYSVIVQYNTIFFLEVSIILVRIEPSSAVPIYRQIIDQIKYQVATGFLREGDRVPSVRQLANELAVNQNTILKVYGELCRENVLKVERGDGTYVAAGRRTISAAERKRTVASVLREAVVQAAHLDVSLDQMKELLEKEYQSIKLQEQKNRSRENE
jgi:GntR family transcriptional regulator